MNFKKSICLYWVIVLVAMSSFDGHAMENNPTVKIRSALYQLILNNEIILLSDMLEKNPEYCFLIDDKGRTLLHDAAEYGKVAAVNTLLEKSNNPQALVLRPN